MSEELPDAHTLNACLARVIGEDIEQRVDPDGRIYFLYWRECGGCHSLQEWDPVHDANQMALVKEKLKEMVPAHSLNMHWGGSQWIVKLRIYDGGEYKSLHESEPIAFALAVQAWWNERVE